MVALVFPSWSGEYVASGQKCGRFHKKRPTTAHWIENHDVLVVALLNVGCPCNHKGFYPLETRLWQFIDRSPMQNNGLIGF
jgi:hypothetical protein